MDVDDLADFGMKFTGCVLMKAVLQERETCNVGVPPPHIEWLEFVPCDHY